MWIKVGNKPVVEIYDEVIQDILGIYPEEELMHRPFFESGFSNGYLSYKGLLKECESIQIPWQMFFLTLKNFKKQLNNVEKFRKYKFSNKFFAKRKGIGELTSKRIIDRLIRLQNYVVKNFTLPPNSFCGALRGKTYVQCVKYIISFFEINMSEFRSKAVNKALDYLINQVETKGINVSRGILKGGILPEVKGISSVYKNTSGFIIKDKFIPFIFLPDEINPDEVAGRRIYTLIYLLVCIGLDEYDFYIESNFKASALSRKGTEAKKHNITTSIILPEKETDSLRGSELTKVQISEIANMYKMTPTAVVVTLKRRGIITQEEYEQLLPPPYKPKKIINSYRKRPRITSSVRKFCGKQVSEFVNDGIKKHTLSSVEAQYLIFGRVQKKLYKVYCEEIL